MIEIHLGKLYQSCDKNIILYSSTDVYGQSTYSGINAILLLVSTPKLNSCWACVLYENSIYEVDIDDIKLFV